LARVANSWQEFYDFMLAGSGATDGNVDLYLFDYIMYHSDTTTWDIEIAVKAEDPITFPRRWSVGGHTYLGSPFVGRNFNNPAQFIFTG
jgi:hypothetical protein